MSYGDTSYRTVKCENCSAVLQVSEMSQPDPERYTLYCVWCGAFLESGKAGTHPQVKLISAGDATKKRSE
jgi:ribosomal protein S27E